MSNIGSDIVVLGAGGIGSAAACRLAGAYPDRVTVVDAWLDHVDAVRSRGLTVDYGTEIVTTHPRALSVDELDQLDRPTLVLLAVKSYDTTPVLQAAVPFLGTAPVVSLQNCINEDAITAIVGADRTIGAVVMFDGMLIAPGQATSTHRGALIIGELSGELSPRVRELATVLEPVDHVETVGDIWTRLWAKLAANATMNAWAALLDRPVGEVVADRRCAEVAVGLGAECIRTAMAGGFDLSGKDIHGATSDCFVTPYGSGDWERAVDGVTRFFLAIPDVLPSTLQDTRKGRRTEVDQLNGYVARRGAALGVSTPLNQRVTDLLLQFERTGARPAPDAVIPELHGVLTGSLIR